MEIVFLTRQPLLAMGVQLIFKPYQSFEVSAVSSEDPELFEILKAPPPDMVLLDFAPEEDFGLLLRLRKEIPGSKIILSGRKLSAEVAYQVVNAGVKGIVEARLPAETLLECVREVAAGGLWFDRELTASVMGQKMVVLSPRETQLVLLVAQGLKNKEIAAALGLTDATVRMYLSALFRKVGVKDRYELAIYGARHLLQSAQLASAALDGSLGTAGIRVLMLERPTATFQKQGMRVQPDCVRTSTFSVKLA